jgi:hypothetical protein
VCVCVCVYVCLGVEVGGGGDGGDEVRRLGQSPVLVLFESNGYGTRLLLALLWLHSCYTIVTLLLQWCNNVVTLYLEELDVLLDVQREAVCRHIHALN